MSKFRTVIPVDTKAILAKLPHGSYLHEIKMTPEKDGVEVIWDNDLIVAKFQQIDFPPECFDGELPADVVRVIGMESKVQSPKSKVEEAPAQDTTAASPALEEVAKPGVGNNPVAPVGKKPKK
jgi:hypothetical protein